MGVGVGVRVGEVVVMFSLSRSRRMRDRFRTMPSVVSLVIVTVLIVGTGESSCFELCGSPAERERKRRRDSEFQREVFSRSEKEGRGELTGRRRTRRKRGGRSKS